MTCLLPNMNYGDGSKADRTYHSQSGDEYEDESADEDCNFTDRNVTVADHCMSCI